MKKTILFTAALCACFAFSCKKSTPVIDDNEEEVIPEPTERLVIIGASIEDDITKTSYGGANGTTFSWTAGDTISVYCTDGLFHNFIAQSSGASTTFAGTLTGETNIGTYAYFPASKYHTTTQFSIPKYKNLVKHISADIPMIGSIEDNHISFQHCSGAVLFSMNNIPNNIDSVKVSFVSAGLKLSGLFDIKPTGTPAAGSYYDGAESDSDPTNTFIRTVPVSSNKAEVYLPYAHGFEMWAPNTINVIGYDGATPYNLVINKSMKGISSYNFEKSHVKPLKTLPVSNVSCIDWTSVTQTFAGINDRIVEWKATSDDYYLYFNYKFTKAKYKKDGSSSFYIGFDLDNDAKSGDQGEHGGTGPDAGLEALVYFYPWIDGDSDGNPSGVVQGEDATSYIKKPVGTTVSGKVQLSSRIDGSYAYISVSVPRSSLGITSGSSVTVRTAAQYYKTNLQSVTF